MSTVGGPTSIWCQKAAERQAEQPNPNSAYRERSRLSGIGRKFNLTCDSEFPKLGQAGSPPSSEKPNYTQHFSNLNKALSPPTSPSTTGAEKTGRASADIFTRDSTGQRTNETGSLARFVTIQFGSDNQ